MRERVTVGRMHVLTAVIAVLAASLFLFSFAPFAGAATVHNGKTMVVKGEVVSVNNYAQIVTVKAIAKPPAEKQAKMYKFSVTGNTWITACAQNRSFFDLGSGQNVNITYHSRQGKLIADNIAIQGTDLASCYIYR